MAAGVQKAWSATASSNANSDSNINFAEGQAPSTVNDSARALMAGVKAFANQIGGAKTSAGAGNAYTFTSDSAGAISTAYAAGMSFRFKADKTNTGAATFNADGVGAVDIRKGGAQTALVAGDIVQNGIYDVAHNGTYFILLNPETGQGAAGFQPLDATLTALAALTITANTYIKGTGTDTFSVVAVSTLSAQGYLSVHRNGTNQTSMTGGAANKIQFTTEEFDVSGWFDNATNYRYTPLVAGYYHVCLGITATNGAAETPQAIIYKNGSAAVEGTYSGGTSFTGTFHSQADRLIYMNGSTDYLEGYVYLPSGVTSLLGTVTRTYMTIVKVGE